MRADMSQVVIERPRRGSAFGYHDVRPRCSGLDLEALDNLPKHQGYRRPHRETGDWKQFSDLLGPVHAFVRSNVGRVWDEVYSEIRAHIDQRNEVQYHLLTHIEQYIEIKTFIDRDGDICTAGNHFWRNRKLREGDIYVHPISGLICEIPNKRRRDPRYERAVHSLYAVFGNHWHSVVQKGKADTGSRYSDNAIIHEAHCHVSVGPERDLHKINGIWYWAVYADVPPPFTMHWISTTGDAMSRVVRRSGTDFLTGVVYHEGRYRHDKRQASRRDLRRYRLRND